MLQDFRKRLRKYAHLAASLERGKAFEAREHLHGICQAFARFLAEATDFYASLLRRFEAMQHQYAKGAGAGAGSVDSSERRSRLVRLLVMSINRCFIFLGDLARYRELHGENSAKDWSSAERFYHQVGGTDGVFAVVDRWQLSAMLVNLAGGRWGRGRGVGGGGKGGGGVIKCLQ